MRNYFKYHYTGYGILYYRKPGNGSHSGDVPMHYGRKCHPGVALLKGKFGSKAGFPVSIVIGSILKGLFMGVVISLIILPNMLPEKMAPMLRVLQLQFSLTQVVTALIGGVYAFIIAAALRKTSLGKQD